MTAVYIGLSNYAIKILWKVPPFTEITWTISWLKIHEFLLLNFFCECK